MEDISLHLLDMIENSIRADCQNIWLNVSINKTTNRLLISVVDDGIGMDEETLKAIDDPFYTTKNREKKIGLGISLFKQNAEMCNGSFNVTSILGEKTAISAAFQFDHIDRMPIGRLDDTLLNSVIAHPEIEYHLVLSNAEAAGEADEFIFETDEIKRELGETPITYPDVISYIDTLLHEGIKTVKMEEY